MRILEALLKAPVEGWTRQEIQDASGMTDNEAFNGLQNLRHRLLVRVINTDGSNRANRYRLSGLGVKAAKKGGAA